MVAPRDLPGKGRAEQGISPEMLSAMDMIAMTPEELTRLQVLVLVRDEKLAQGQCGS